jgi:hypothetical protein
MRLREIAVLLAISSGSALAADTCPVTPAPSPAFVPPSPYRSAGSERAFYVGTAKLWVLVYAGPWRGLPVWPEGYRQKLAWWSEGYVAKADPTPAISITGRRLDGPAPPMLVTGANGSWTTEDFIMSGVNFPTVGCWEVTGRFRGAEAKFVVLIEP